jgi:pimeloyl-ACP methyl ester carboxylesterase
MKFHRAYTTCRFGQLHYGRMGQGRTLILLHQNPYSMMEFSVFAAEMAADRDIIAFDMPGNGMSDTPPETVLLPDYAGALADGLDALGVTGAVDVLGYHTGAYLAVELAVARPDIVGRIILSGIAYRTASERAAQLAAHKRVLPSDDDGESVLDFVKRMWNYTVVLRDPSVPLERAITRYADRIRPMHRATWPYEAVWRFDALERFAAVTQPALVLQANDPRFAHWRQAVARLGNATVLEFPHLHKDIWDTGAPAFAAAIRGWQA